MPAPTPTTVEALRQYARAVVLVASHGASSRSLAAAAHDSGVDCRLIGHPLLAMAELCRFDREAAARAPGERVALFIVDRDIDDLEPLFTSVQTRLPRVSIWVVQGDIVVPVRIAEPEPVVAPPATGVRRPPASPASAGSSGTSLPKLRFVEGAPSELEPDGIDAAHPEPEAHAGAGDPAPSRGSEAVTSAELDMLLGFLDGDRRDRPSGDRGGPR